MTDTPSTAGSRTSTLSRQDLDRSERVTAALASSRLNGTTTTIFESDLTRIGRVVFKTKKPTKDKKKDTDKNNISSEEKDDQKEEEVTLACQVYSIRLGRLLESSSSLPSVVSLRRRARHLFDLKRTRDLIHTVSALYDTCLPDIGAQSVYDCVTAAKSFTILVVRDSYLGDESHFVDDSTGAESKQAAVEQSEYESDDCLSVVMEGADEYEEKTRLFKNVFSDVQDEDEDDEEEESGEESDEDNTMGVKSFLNQNDAKVNFFLLL